MMRSYVSIDLETTGLNPKTDKIIEIGAVRIIDGEHRETFSSLVNPGRKLDPRIVELTGLSDEELSGAPYIEEILPDALCFTEDLPLLGHSVLFDFSFLKKAATNNKLVFEKQAVDTLKIARKYLAGLEHRNLDYLCGHYQIPHQAHRALADAEATVLLYERLAEQFYSEEEALFRPQTLQFKAKKDAPAAKSQKERLYKLAEKHNITLDVEIERLTQSEASRCIDKIRARHKKDLQLSLQAYL